MIQKNNITVTCPTAAGSLTSAPGASSARARPFLRKREVLAGEIFRHTCPHCGKSNQFAYDCLYSRREFMLYLLPTCQGRTLPLSAEEEKVFRRMGRKFPMRLENTVDGFLDHLRVLEDKYLDKPFELVRERALQGLPPPAAPVRPPALSGHPERPDSLQRLSAPAQGGGDGGGQGPLPAGAARHAAHRVF